MIVSPAEDLARAQRRTTFGFVGIFPEEAEFVVECAHYAPPPSSLLGARLCRRHRAALDDALFGKEPADGLARLRAFPEPRLGLVFVHYQRLGLGARIVVARGSR